MFIEYKLGDGSVAIVEATEEVAAFISEEHRTTENKNRHYRYYAPYSIDALIYEGMDYADTDTPEEKRHSLHLRKLCRILFGLKIPN